MHEALDILRWFAIARRLDRESSRERLEHRQKKLIARLQRRVFPRSRFYAAHAGTPFAQVPLMDKSRWMAAFDAINTADIRLNEALALAERAEVSRDFTPTIGGVTVGLSTGTSGKRGVFLVSSAERRRWAGVMLAKLLPAPAFKRRRVAFFLRANSRLYESASGFNPITFRYFDLLAPWPDLLDQIASYAPQILIAPASVLRALAQAQREGKIKLAPERVISVAETLYADDRHAIESAFKAPLGEVYQASEGALAMTCERGGLHLNEAFVHFEFDWIDRASGRFAPIITDLTRETQPVVRYRLDDVLLLSPAPCACGRAARTISAIEGRCDDVCTLRRADGSVQPLFADFIVRAILGASPEIADFTAEQKPDGGFAICLFGAAQAEGAVRAALENLALRLGAVPPSVIFVENSPPRAKRRRVINSMKPGAER